MVGQSKPQGGKEIEMNGIKYHSTYLENIKYARYAAGMWGFFDFTTDKNRPAHVGKWYPTKELLLLDMKSYLREHWGYTD